ncbi:hypothetical protein H4582DRAFT_2056259 [Lactarius indigo]|nr:hypothetical protein H4582DRAFT_2056259 [Lactarius indigo]
MNTTPTSTPRGTAKWLITLKKSLVGQGPASSMSTDETSCSTPPKVDLTPTDYPLNSPHGAVGPVHLPFLDDRILKSIKAKGLRCWDPPAVPCLTLKKSLVGQGPASSMSKDETITCPALVRTGME